MHPAGCAARPTSLPLLPLLRYHRAEPSQSIAEEDPLTEVVMPQLTESAAERLTPAQATALVRVLDLQARWEAHRDDPAKSASSTADLHERQKAHNVFQAALRDYCSRYGDAAIPEPTQNMPKRLAIWCRVLRGIFRRAEGGCP